LRLISLYFIEETIMKKFSLTLVVSFLCFFQTVHAASLESMEQEFFKRAENWTLLAARENIDKVFMKGECYDVFSTRVPVTASLAVFSRGEDSAALFVTHDGLSPIRIMRVAKDHHANMNATALKEGLLGDLFYAQSDSNGTWTNTFKIIDSSKVLILRSEYSVSGYFCPNQASSCSPTEAVYVRAGETAQICAVKLENGIDAFL
jgi:hypothetical protein